MVNKKWQTQQKEMKNMVRFHQNSAQPADTKTHTRQLSDLDIQWKTIYSYHYPTAQLIYYNHWPLDDGLWFQSEMHFQKNMGGK